MDLKKFVVFLMDKKSLISKFLVHHHFLEVLRRNIKGLSIQPVNMKCGQIA